MGSNSPYKTRSFPFRRHWTALNLIDEEGVPTPRVRAVWEGAKAVTSSPTNKAAAPVAMISRPRRSRSERARTPAAQLPETGVDSRTIFIGNLPNDIERHELLEISSSFGEVRRLTMPVDIFTGKIRGFAFVEFDTSASAQMALVGIRGIVCRSRKLRTDVANRQ